MKALTALAFLPILVALVGAAAVHSPAASAAAQRGVQSAQPDSLEVQALKARIAHLESQVIVMAVELNQPWRIDQERQID